MLGFSHFTSDDLRAPAIILKKKHTQELIILFQVEIIFL